MKTECNCDMPYWAYLDWLREEGWTDNDFIEEEELVVASGGFAGHSDSTADGLSREIQEMDSSAFSYLYHPEYQSPEPFKEGIRAYPRSHYDPSYYYPEDKFVALGCGFLYTR